MAREAAAEIIEAWIRKHHETDSKLTIKHVEMGFSIWLDPTTLVVGVQDMIAEDSEGLLGHEWKTHAEPKPNSKYGEENWLEEILRGHQIALYALAQREGTFYEHGNPTPFQLGIESPRERVRAAVKSNPPKFWPKIPSRGLISFTPEKLDSVKQGFLAKAEEIRALRRTAYLPWQLPGKQCFSYGRMCGFFKEFCEKGNPPENLAVTIFDPSDPAMQAAVSHIDPDVLQNPDLVILSASSYELASACKEKHRIISGSLGEKGRDLALDTGTAFHAGIAEYYRQLRDSKL